MDITLPDMHKKVLALVSDAIHLLNAFDQLDEQYKELARDGVSAKMRELGQQAVSIVELVPEDVPYTADLVGHYVNLLRQVCARMEVTAMTRRFDPAIYEDYRDEMAKTFIAIQEHLRS